ncbi:MAG: DUF177 domain-containing protein [Eubacteriales bacterium]|nr:DUF177 domain-containing protein [Eubacteriales bacterium]
MQLDFTNLFGSSNEIIDIDYKVNFDDFFYGTYQPLKDGVIVRGRAYCKADVVHMDLDISFNFYGVCDRCVDDFKREYSFSVSKIVVHGMDNDEDDFDDYLVVDNNKLNLDDLVEEEINLHLPLKMLCKDDCAGICPQCGQNLNHKKCNCKKEVDPRMAALLQLLDED